MHELIETATTTVRRPKCFTATRFATDLSARAERQLPSGRERSRQRQAKAQHIAFIASYEPGTLKQFSTSVVFWRRARTRLDRLGNRITPEDRARRSRRRSRVPVTTPEQEQACDREFGEGLRRLKKLAATRR